MSYRDVNDMDASSQLPNDLMYVGYNAERGMYQYRDGAGRVWEGHPTNVYGTLHLADEPSEYFNSPPHTATASSFGSPSATPATPATPSSPAAPMTHFPDTWDPPAGYEVDELPAKQRIAHKMGNFRRNVLGGRSHGPSEPVSPLMSSGRSTTWSVDQKTTLEKRPSVLSTFSTPSSMGATPKEGAPRRTGTGFWSMRSR